MKNEPLGSSETRRRVAPVAMVLGGVALVVLVVLSLQGAWGLWIEWRAHRCVAEIRALAGPDGLGEGRLPSWESVVGSGKSGFPVVSRVLRGTDEGHVLVGVWEAIARVADEAYRTELWDYLQGSEPDAFVRFILLRGNPTRVEDLGDMLYFDDRWPERWCAEGRTRMEPTEGGLRFCEAVLHGDVLDGVAAERRRLYRDRAIDTLAVMLPAGDLPPRDPERDEIEPRIVELLARSVQQRADEELLYRAVARLIQRADVSFTGLGPDRIESWWCFVHLDERRIVVPMMPALGVFNAIDAGDLLGLVHLDRVETLDVLARLYERPESREVLDGILKAGVPSLPFPPPTWLPFHEAARRFLERAPRDRLWAAMVLAELGDPAGVPVLEEALEKENDPDLQVLFEACLVALGQRERRDAVWSVLRERPFKVVAYDWDEIMGVEGVLELWDPPSWDRERGIVEVCGNDLARLLLMSGDREALDAVMQSWLARPSAEPAVDLSEVIEPWIFGAGRDDYFGVRVRLGGHDGVIVTPPPPDLEDSLDFYAMRNQLTSDLERELLVSYWKGVGSSLRWQGGRRRFVSDAEAFASWVMEALSTTSVPVPIATRWIAAMPPSEASALATKLADALVDYYAGAPAGEEHLDEVSDVYAAPGYYDWDRSVELFGEVAAWPWRSRDMLGIRSDTTEVRLDDRGGCLTAILQLSGSGGRALVAPLVRALRSSEPDLRHLAVVALGRIGPDAGEAMPSLRELLADEGWIAAKEAARAIARIDGTVGNELGLLSCVVDDPDRHPTVRAIAARAVASYGERARDLLPTLERVMRDRSAPDLVRAQAGWALWQIDRREDIIRPLEEILRDGKGAARTVSALTLAEMGAAAAAALPVLAGVLAGPVAEDKGTAQFHIEAAAALLRIDPHHPAAARAVEVLLRYSRYGVTPPPLPACPDAGALRACHILESYRRTTGAAPGAGE